MNQKKFIRVQVLAEMLSVSRSTIWRWCKSKSNFPQPIKISQGVTVWLVEEVQEWMAENINKKSELLQLRSSSIHINS